MITSSSIPNLNINNDEIISSKENLSLMLNSFYIAEFSISERKLTIYNTINDYTNKSILVKSLLPINSINITLYTQIPGSVGISKNNIVYLGPYEIDSKIFSIETLREHFKIKT